MQAHSFCTLLIHVYCLISDSTSSTNQIQAVANIRLVDIYDSYQTCEFDVIYLLLKHVTKQDSNKYNISSHTHPPIGKVSRFQADLTERR